MKNYFLVLCICAVCCLNNQTYGQDIIKTKTGEEIKARLLKITRKGATYKTYDDPEFSTFTLPYKELSSIQKQGEKKPILFNHKLPRGYVCLSIGPPGLARPLGSFAKNDYQDAKSEPGFASEGVNIKFDFAGYLWKRLGLSIGTGYTFYKFDYDGYRDVYYNEDVTGTSVNVDYKDYSSSNPTSDETFRKNKWTFGHLMLGPVYSIKIGKRITQDLKVRVGFVWTRKPALFIGYSSFDGSAFTQATFYYNESEKVDFSYNLGTSTRVALSKRLALCLAADFIHTSPDMTINSYQVINSVVSYPSTTVYYEISSLNLSLGFAYQFKRKKNKFE